MVVTGCSEIIPGRAELKRSDAAVLRHLRDLPARGDLPDVDRALPACRAGLIPVTGMRGNVPAVRADRGELHRVRHTWEFFLQVHPDDRSGVVDQVAAIRAEGDRWSTALTCQAGDFPSGLAFPETGDLVIAARDHVFAIRAKEDGPDHAAVRHGGDLFPSIDLPDPGDAISTTRDHIAAVCADIRRPDSVIVHHPGELPPR